MEDIEVQFGVDGTKTKVKAEKLIIGGVTFWLSDAYRIVKLPPNKPELAKGYLTVSRAGLHLHSFKAADAPDVKEYMRNLIREQCGVGKDFKPQKLLDMFISHFKLWVKEGKMTSKELRLEERVLRQELKL